MSIKSQVTGTVVSDKMEKTVVVAVERQVRHEVYGKSQRRTSKFVAHNENNEAKVGDTVAIAESRPLSRRKRWVVTRVVAKAAHPEGTEKKAEVGRGVMGRTTKERRGGDGTSTPSAPTAGVLVNDQNEP